MPADETSALHRSFYAVRLSDEANRYIMKIIAELRRHDANVGWTSEGNLHLTLRFLGELTDEQFKSARTLPSTEPLLASFTIAAVGLGAYPLLRAPRILWAGIDGESQQDIDWLLHLQARSEQWSRRLGLQPENRRYSPHITIGRVRQPLGNLRPLIDDMTTRECRSPFSEITELLLIESTLSPGGSIYREVERWPLKRSLNSGSAQSS